jgi:hypothetical protein
LKKKRVFENESAINKRMRRENAKNSFCATIEHNTTH